MGLTQVFRYHIYKMNEKLIPFYKLLKKDAIVETTKEHVKSVEVINMDLIKLTIVLLQLPKPSLEYVYLCDASYNGSGFVKKV